MLVGEFAREALADIHAAGKGNSSVDAEDLSVGAQIGIGQPEADDDVAIEDVDLHAALAQITHDARHGIAGADGIDEYADADTAFGRGNQGIGDAKTDRVAVEDIGLHQDAALGAVDCGFHRGIGDVTIRQHLDRVAGAHRVADDTVAERLHRTESIAEPPPHLIVIGVEAGELAIRILAEERVALRAEGGPADAIDAGDSIEHGTDDGRQDDNADPADRGADILLGHGCMDCSGRPHRDGQDGENLAPMGSHEVDHDASISLPAKAAMSGPAIFKMSSIAVRNLILLDIFN